MCTSAPSQNCSLSRRRAPNICARRGRAHRAAAGASCARRGRWFRRSSNTARRPAKELAIFRAAAEIRRTYGAGAIRTAIISKTQGVSDMLELALLLKEVGLVTATGRAEINIVPLFETIDDLRACVEVMDRLLALPEYRRLVD